MLTRHHTTELYPQPNKTNFVKSLQINYHTDYTLGLGQRLKKTKKNETKQKPSLIMKTKTGSEKNLGNQNIHRGKLINNDTECVNVLK